MTSEIAVQNVHNVLLKCWRVADGSTVTDASMPVYTDMAQRHVSMAGSLYCTVRIHLNIRASRVAATPGRRANFFWTGGPWDQKDPLQSGSPQCHASPSGVLPTRWALLRAAHSMADLSEILRNRSGGRYPTQHGTCVFADLRHLLNLPCDRMAEQHVAAVLHFPGLRFISTPPRPTLSPATTHYPTPRQRQQNNCDIADIQTNLM
jgi:hypothetical protein